MDDETAARIAASFCGALSVLADVIQNASDVRKAKAKPVDVLTQGLAYSDGWLDQIMPKRLHVDAKGKASFGLRDE